MSKLAKRLIILSGIWPLGLQLAMADQGATPQPLPALDDKKTSITTSSAAGPPSPVSDSLSQVSVEAGQANDTASIVVRTRKGLGLKISTPVTKGATATNFSNLDKLANNTALSVSWIGFKFPTESSDPACTQKICDQFKITGSCSAGKLEDELKKNNWSQAAINGEIARFQLCDFGKSWLHGMKIEGGVGYKTFDFFNENGTTGNDYKISQSAAASYVGVYGPGRFSAGLSYQESYADSKTSVQHCDNVGGSNTLQQCKQLPLGSPVKDKSTIARIEIRHIFSFFAVSPLASWDIKKKALGLDLPIYFISNSESHLSGGVRFGWRSDGGGAKASIFVSNPLSLF